jgi:DNA-binding beta-propeller fold protein YncE
MIKNRLLKILFSLAVPLIFFSCGGGEKAEIIWPNPPDEPRIKYIKSYYGPSDIVKRSFFIDSLLGSEGSVRFSKPMGILYDNATGRLFIADTAKKTVFIMDKGKERYSALHIRGREAFAKPITPRLDSKGRLFVTDSAGKQVLMFDKNGRYVKHVFAEGKWTRPTGLAIDKKRKRIYVSDTHKHRIRVFDEDSLKLIQTIGGIRGPEEGEMNFPTHMAINKKNGDLIVTDTMNARVQIFDYKGRFKISFGEFGDGPGFFARPKGVAIDSEDHIYVSDAGFNNIQIFDYEGNVLLAFSGFGQREGNLILPAGIYVDDDDIIYVSDSFNERISIFEFLGDKHKARESKGTELER